MILTFSASLLCLLALSAADEVAPPFTHEEKEAIAILPIVPRPMNATVTFACHSPNHNNNNRVYPAEEVRRWPNNMVPYIIPTNFTTDERVRIGQAMRHIESKSWVRFIYRSEEVDYVNIGSDQSGCYTQIGFHNGSGPHDMNLERPHCLDMSTIVHELLHILGSDHEMTRPDRDDFVTIQWANIHDEYAYNFWKNREIDNANDDEIPTCTPGHSPYDNCVSGYAETTTVNLPYDYKSVMHYYAYDLATNSELPVITFRNPAIETLRDSFGNSIGMTELDEQKLKAVYHC